ncbi:MAG: radical SAM protein [Actinobacteria bacterium]|nr:radical SAM protein [Actinomycetota bacterium]
MLVDGFNRKIDYLRLSVTDRCNLRCAYCMPSGGIRLIDRKEILTFEEILKAAGILSEMGIRKIRITGGEPLVRIGIIDLIKQIKKIEKITDISITTNGILLNEYLDELYKIPVSGINISLDTLDRQKYKEITRGGEINQVLNAISNSINIGIKSVKINTVITNLLDEEDIKGFVDMTLDKPVHVRFIEMMQPAGDCGSPETIECSSIGGISNLEFNNLRPDSFSQGFNSVDTIFSVMKKIGGYHAVNDKIGNGPALYYKFKKARGSIGFIINDKQYCSYCNRIRLTPYGTIRLCLFSDKEYDIKKKIRDNYCSADIKAEIAEFVKAKPENREESCRYVNKGKVPIDFKLKDFMNRIGG